MENKIQFSIVVSLFTDDEHSFASAVSSVYQDVESAEEISRKNSRDVEAYTWKAKAENILNFIHK